MMPEFVTFDELETWNKKLDERQVLRKAVSTLAGKTVFLSHSSADKKYLPAVITVLENNGGFVYVDSTDKRLPESPNRETANILRSTIKRCRRFVLFVTTNSKDSRWVPWELGLADGEKGTNAVALFPVGRHSWQQQWAEQEYLGLYRRIVWGQIRGHPEPEWIFLDHVANSASPLRDWLSGR